jgi:hypothetical protein
MCKGVCKYAKEISSFAGYRENIDHRYGGTHPYHAPVAFRGQKMEICKSVSKSTERMATTHRGKSNRTSFDKSCKFLEL